MTRSGVLTSRPAANLVTTTRRIGFWGGVALPLVYLPLLVSSVGGHLLTVAGLLVAHVVCLVVGHEYQP